MHSWQGQNGGSRGEMTGSFSGRLCSTDGNKHGYPKRYRYRGSGPGFRCLARVPKQYSTEKATPTCIRFSRTAMARLAFGNRKGGIKESSNTPMAKALNSR